MTSIIQEYNQNMKDAYCHAKVQVLAVQHGLQCRVAYPQFTSNAEVAVTLANRGGCTRCIGMYWDVFWMYQIKFGCINIPIHHRCIGMYFRGIVMYYKMY